MNMTSSVIWLIVVVALGLPSALMGLLIRRLEKKMDKQEKARDAKEELRIKHEVMMIDLSMASLSLAEATAEAVQRIPDAHCNGEMKAALDKSKETKEKYRTFEREQMAKSII